MKRPLGLPLTLLAAAGLFVAACGGGGATTQPGTSTAPVQSAGAGASTGTASAVASAGQSLPGAASEEPGASTGTETPGATTGTGSPSASTGGESPSTSGAPGGSPTAIECPASAQGQTVEMWSPLTGPDGDEMTGLAQRFTQENQWGITVNHVPQPDYMRSLTTPGQLPTMSIVRVINVGELAARNVLRPFTDETMGLFAGIESDFPEGVWSRGEYNGQRYSIPLDASPLVLYYNKDMFAAANVEEPGTEPMTPDQFDAAFTALKDSGVQPISIGTGFQAGVLFHTLIYQYGGALTNEEGTQATFASPEGVQALTKLQQLRTDSGSTASGTGDPEVQEFSAGQSAMVIHGPWHISNLIQDPKVGFAPVPQWGDTYAVWGSSHQFALTTDDPAQQAAATCWMRWLSDNSVGWAAAGQAPARNSVRQDPALATEAPGIAAVASSADDLVILPQVPALESAVWGQGYGPAVDAILLGEQTDIQAALDSAQQTSQQLIDDNAEQYANPSTAPSP